MKNSQLNHKIFRFLCDIFKENALFLLKIQEYLENGKIQIRRDRSSNFRYVD